MSLRDEIKKSIAESPAAVAAVPTPDLPDQDGKIFVRRVSAAALASYWKDADETPDDERARFVQLVASDAEGSPIFQAEDVLWLSTTPHLMPTIERVYWEGRRHNGLTEENREGWRKNLRSTAAGGSRSCSPEPSSPDTAST